MQDGYGLTQSGVAMVAAGVFGALWGSFYNVCIARIPRGMSVVRPPSHCFSCQAPVRPWDNIPILSYAILGGRCRSCGVGFSPRYALVEVLTGLLAAFVWWRFVSQGGELPAGIQVARFAMYFAFVSVLIVLSFIDLDTKRLPDIITLPSIPVFFLAGFGVGDVPWMDRAIGAVVGYAFVRLVADGYYYIRGREGLGLGDGKLLSVIGAVLGWQALPFVVFTAALVGVLVSVPMLLMIKRHPPAPVVADPAAPPVDEAEELRSVRHAQVPFGPFLAMAALVYLFFRDAVESALASLGLRGGI